MGNKEHYYMYDKTDPKSIEEYGKQLDGLTFEDIKNEWPMRAKEDTSDYRNGSRKGGLGNFIESKVFYVDVNSRQEADIPEAGVELKVTPYEKNKNGELRAGERLVLSMISYEKEVEPDLLTSHFWQKIRLMLLMFYLRDRTIKDKWKYRIDHVKLFSPPEKDLEIIKQDYKTIIDKVAAGKADELSESDTNYLGACTKGASAEKSTVPQTCYAPNVKARKRAFCFKTGYMSYVLNEYIVGGKQEKTSLAKGEDECESIIKSVEELKEHSFKEVVINRINGYIGKTDKELCDMFGLGYTGNKAQWTQLTFRMLGIRSNKAEEFQKAQVVVKTICLEADGRLRESSPFPPEILDDIVHEKWEDSKLYNYLSESQFLFVVFKKSDESDDRVLVGCDMWHMPYEDFDGDVREGWERVKATLIRGVRLEKKMQGDKIIVTNDLLKKTENRVIHMRPHAPRAYYDLGNGEIFGSGGMSCSDRLPDGRRIPKQSFWLNSDYILENIIAHIKRNHGKILLDPIDEA